MIACLEKRNLKLAIAHQTRYSPSLRHVRRIIADGVLGDIVELNPGPGSDWTLELVGPFADALPQDQEQNIVITSCRRFQAAAIEAGAQVTPLSVTLDKRLPVGSGLGSSASSIVAAFEALNRWHAHLLPAQQLFGLMAR